ncbi:MBL fold metallo-hydrolase [Mesorhizobium sp. YR577]|uniref:MBL fold metallo-hydrolase n=1 Tax=Mesorhizobium sp. YR577 TaxID=1884373 RepID=UPI0008EAEDC2|nr:MBL fold metallo-hydrolase [Mesorhizobium sp. YR577]SFU21444.1 metallo-beta-lactamase family protein [Mesorhizobium sp. YR577]
MKPILRFHGAAHGVTGSCYELETGTRRLLIDCGLFQGSKSEKALNYGDFPFDPASIDAVILTHAHIDHSGLLPKLVRHGFDGAIYATSATIDLCSVMLPDSAHIQEMEVENLNRRNAQRGKPLVSPIYTMQDATACMTQFRPVAYTVWTTIADGVRARFWNAGHLLGSASVEVEIDQAGGPLRMLFSGDIGPGHKLFQTDPEAPSGIDYLICESTYGDRDRPEVTREARRNLLGVEVRRAANAAGPLIIPSFAVERTQELLVDLFLLAKSGDIPAATPIFVDSPLATRASAIFERHASDIVDGDILRQALNSRNIRFTETVEQSKGINRLVGFFIVIAASGMCDAGRIRHHLKANLWRRNATVMLAGYQSQGSLGRILLDGAARVRIQGDEVDVKAHIGQFDLYSGHADASELVSWVKKCSPIRQTIFLTHGEEAGLAGLRMRLANASFRDASVVLPLIDDAYELGPTGSRQVDLNRPRRLHPEKVARLDWHNDLSRLLIDITESVNAVADERGRAAIIRRLRRALKSSA